MNKSLLAHLVLAMLLPFALLFGYRPPDYSKTYDKDNED